MQSPTDFLEAVKINNRWADTRENGEVIHSMNEPKKPENGVLGDVIRNSSAFFRHLLPGVYILGAAYVAHPSWFAGMDFKSWQHIAIAGATALASGNIWFSLNRYGVHQFIDYFVYLFNSEGPARGSSCCRYIEDLGKYVSESLYAEIPERARQHVAFRASSVLLIYTVAEVGLLFSFWHEPDTFFSTYKWKIAGSSALTFVVGFWQNILTRRIDYGIVKRSGPAGR